MTGDREPPRPRRPLRAGVGDADPRRDLDRAVVDGIGGVIHVALEAETRRRVTQVATSPGRVDPECRGDQAGPARETFDAGHGDAGR